MASLRQRSLAEVGLGLLHGSWNAGPSRRKRMPIENRFRQINYSSNRHIGAPSRRCRPLSHYEIRLRNLSLRVTRVFSRFLFGGHFEAFRLLG